jgi:epoxyqueuosine reductase
MQERAFEAALREQAQRLGFDDLAVCSVEPFTHWQQAAPQGLKTVLHADPQEILPEARSLIVTVSRYNRYEPWPQGSGQLAQYYTRSNTSHDTVEELACWLREQGHQAVGNPALPHRAAALRTGMGAQGWNQQFCHDRLGVAVYLGLVLTDAPLATQDAPYRTCMGCGRCVKACPTGALKTGDGFERPLCLRHHMAGPDAVPEELRAKMGSRLMGCTECVDACPLSHAQKVGIPPELPGICALEPLLRGDPAAMESLRAAIGTNYARKHRIQAQAALLAGNSGDRTMIPALVELLREHPAEHVRRHSAWALGQLGGPQACEALDAAWQTETQEAVKEEIQHALDAARV